MDADLLRSAGIDYDDGVRRCAGNTALYEKLLGLFLADENFTSAQRDFAAKDWKALLGHTHELKGMSGNLSMNDLYRTSDEVVKLLRAGSYDQIPAAFEELSTAFDTVSKTIKAALS